MWYSHTENSRTMFQSSPYGTLCALSFHMRSFWWSNKPILDMSKIQDAIAGWILKMKDLFKPSLCSSDLKKRHGWMFIWMI